MSLSIYNNNTLVAAQQESNPVKISLTSAVEAAQAVATESARATAAEASLRTEMRAGRVYTMTGSSPSGLTVPADYSVDLLVMQQRSTNTMTYWRYLNTAPDPAVETKTVKLDAGGTWWTLVADPAIADVARATSLYGTYGGSANAITVTAGLSGIAPGTEIRFRATKANTGPATLNVDGSGAIPCRTITGAVLPAGYIRTTVDTVARYDGTYWVLGREIERGSNANGEYVRFADGTQICTYSAVGAAGPITTAEGAIWRSTEYSWTFPASFAATGNLAVNGSLRAVAAAWNRVRVTGISSASVMLFAASSNANTFTVDFSAIGRWY